MQQWEYSLRFRSPVNVFSGLAVAGLVDRLVVRNQEGFPFIPGSTVKGRWRDTATCLLAAGAPPAGLTGRFHYLDRSPICKDQDNACTLCKLFGNDALPGRLWVGQAELDACWKALVAPLLQLNRNPVVHPDVELRPGVALNRFSRTALKDHLFFDETVPPMVFTGKVLVHGGVTPAELQFLQVSARMVERMGGRKSVGRGILEGGMRFTVKGGAA